VATVTYVSTTPCCHGDEAKTEQDETVYVTSASGGRWVPRPNAQSFVLAILYKKLSYRRRKERRLVSVEIRDEARNWGWGYI